MLQFLKDLYHEFFRKQSSVASDVLNKREQLKLLKLENSASLPDVESRFNLVWTIVHDEDFDDILLFEFRTEEARLLHRELATFEDYPRAKELISLLTSKYRDRLQEIRLTPGVAVYIGGCSASGFEEFAKYVCHLGYELVSEQAQSVKRDGATREIFVPETIFRLSAREIKR